MDLNRLRKLAGLNAVTQVVVLSEEDEIKAGAFHKWLGKSKDEKITDEDVAKGLKSDDPHVRKMAQFAKNMREEVEVMVDNTISEEEKPHDSDIPKVTFMGRSADNTLNLTNVEFHDDTMEYNKSKEGVDVEQESRKVTPRAVIQAIDKRIREITASIDLYDHKGYDDKSVKNNVLDALAMFKKHLTANNVEQYKMAQVYYGTLMSPITDMLPTQLVNYIHNGRDPVVDRKHLG